MTAITDKFTKVGTGTVTSLSAPGKAIAATSINIGSATNYPTDTAVFFAIRRVDPTLVSDTNPSGTVPGTYTVWKGTVSGTIISNLTLQSGGGADQVYPAGTNTQVFIDLTSAQMNSLIDGLLVQHNQDGTHGTITTTGVTNSGGYSQSSGAFTIPTNAIDANELSTSAITLGYTQITANPANFTATSPAQLTGLSQAVTIPAGGRKVEISAFIPTVQAGAGLACTVSIWDGTVGSGTQLTQATQSVGAAAYATFLVSAIVTPAAGAKTYNVGITVSGNAVTVNAGTTFPAYILVKTI